MTYYRTKGPSVRTELAQYFAAFADDREPDSLEIDKDDDFRAAEKELAWLHKEVADLREQLAAMGGTNDYSGRSPLPRRWLPTATTIVITAALAGFLYRRHQPPSSNEKAPVCGRGKWGK